MYYLLAFDQIHSKTFNIWNPFVENKEMETYV